jgi:hypothetical protein
MNIGCDEGLAVSRNYTAPFTFQGRLHLVTLDTPPTRPTRGDQRALAKAELAQQ